MLSQPVRRSPEPFYQHQQQIETRMNLHLSLGPIIALLAGILILIAPRMLSFIVAIYLILIGVIGLLGNNLPHFLR